MQKTRANKFLGQNFLIDKNITSVIEKSFQNQVKNKQVIEIGPGLGHLTQYIIKNNPQKLVLIEKDKRFIEDLQLKFNNSEIIHDDCLICDLTSDVIISNLPYNISNQFLLKIFFNNYAEDIFLMLQEELVQKIINQKEYSYLSVILQSKFHINLICKVNRHCFSPVPQVNSAFIHLKEKNFLNNNENFLGFVKKLFINKNKKLRNILPNFNHSTFESILDKRPNQLKISEIQELYEKLL